MKNTLPYILPVLTLFAFMVYAFINPQVTGFATINKVQVSSDIRLNLDPNVVMPADSLIIVTINDQESNMTLEDFIKKTGREYSYEQGSFPELNYEGMGYTGNYTYTLTLQDFNLGLLEQSDQYLLEIDIVYGDYLISHSEQIIT